MHRKQRAELFFKQILRFELWSSLQNPGQIPVRIQSVFLGCFNQAEVDRAGLGAAGCIREQEVLPGHHKGLN